MEQPHSPEGEGDGTTALQSPLQPQTKNDAGDLLAPDPVAMMYSPLLSMDTTTTEISHDNVIDPLLEHHHSTESEAAETLPLGSTVYSPLLSMDTTTTTTEISHDNVMDPTVYSPLLSMETTTTTTEISHDNVIDPLLEHHHSTESEAAETLPLGSTEQISWTEQQQQPPDGTCSFPGCTDVVAVKSETGHCPVHDGKADRCSVENCDRPAQSSHDGLCLQHWNIRYEEGESATARSIVVVKSVYETVLPQSIAFRPMAAAKAQEINEADQVIHGVVSMDPLNPPPAPEGAIVMPLVAYLQEGISKPFGWHRVEEREARGVEPLDSLSTALDTWERQLAVVEILLLGGGTPYANFQNLAHGWGRKKGFHSALISDVCEARGDLIRKRKAELGMDREEATMPPNQQSTLPPDSPGTSTEPNENENENEGGGMT